MAETEQIDRPTRKAKRPPTKKPNASHYVGYVDDEETPEMIMKKFEMLDKMMEASRQGLFKEPKLKPPKKRAKRDKDDYAYERPMTPPAAEPEQPLGPDQVLNEHQLSLLFKMTSTFNVPTDGFVESSYEGYFDALQLEEDEESYFLGEDEFFGTSSAGDGDKTRKKKREGAATTGRKRKERDLTGVGTYKPKMKLLSMELVGADGLYYTIKKKVKLVDPLAPIYSRVPSQVPLPRSWARSVCPYTGVNNSPAIEGCTYLETDIIGLDLKTLGRKFQGVLIDAPWITGADNPASSMHRVNAEQLYQLRVDEMVDAGLLFVWTEKTQIAECIKVATRWGFTYVENLVWVHQNVDHTIADEPSLVFPQSKTSLLVFKRGSGFALRHQRHPDVIFDFVRESKYLTCDKPNYAYTIAETLLPEACYSEESKQGLFLEIWARRGQHRKGWTTIAQSLPPVPHFLAKANSSKPLKW